MTKKVSGVQWKPPKGLRYLKSLEIGSRFRIPNIKQSGILTDITPTSASVIIDKIVGRSNLDERVIRENIKTRISVHTEVRKINAKDNRKRRIHK